MLKEEGFGDAKMGVHPHLLGGFAEHTRALFGEYTN